MCSNCGHFFLLWNLLPMFNLPILLQEQQKQECLFLYLWQGTKEKFCAHAFCLLRYQNFRFVPPWVCFSVIDNAIYEWMRAWMTVVSLFEHLLIPCYSSWLPLHQGSFSSVTEGRKKSYYQRALIEKKLKRHMAWHMIGSASHCNTRSSAHQQQWRGNVRLPSAHDVVWSFGTCSFLLFWLARTNVKCAALVGTRCRWR